MWNNKQPNNSDEMVEVVSLLSIADQVGFPYEYAFIVGGKIMVRTIFGDCILLKDA